MKGDNSILMEVELLKILQRRNNLRQGVVGFEFHGDMVNLSVYLLISSELRLVRGLVVRETLKACLSCCFDCLLYLEKGNRQKTAVFLFKRNFGISMLLFVSFFFVREFF